MTLFIKDLLSIGAVDAGDNPEAEIVFWKRRRSKKDTHPEVGSLTPDGGDIRKDGMIDIDLSALPDDTREAVTALVEKLVAERDTALEAAAAATIQPEVEPEPVEKQLDPEVAELVAKAKAEADEARAELQVEKAARRRQELVAKIREDGLEPLLGIADEVAPHLESLQSGAPEAFAHLYGSLHAAAQRVELAKAFTELGSAEAEATDPYAQRDRWVEKQLASNPGADIHKLRSDFWVHHPDAFAATREK